jgi:hypothetical protein
MSRTLRPSTRPVLFGLAGAAAVVLLTGCGGSDGSSTADPSRTTGTSPAGASSDEFCDRAAGIDARVDSALSDLDEDGPSVPDAFRAIAVELRSISAPAAISSEWDEMASGLDQMADAVAELDITDLSSLDDLDRASNDLTAASTTVEDYLGDECGL